MQTIDTLKDREWSRLRRQFKQGVKVRARLGVVQTLCEQVGAQRSGQMNWDAPDWDYEQWEVLLYESIRDNQYPTQLLEGFVKTAEVTFFANTRQPTVDKVLAAINTVCRRKSKQLRSRFGVFTDGQQQEATQEVPAATSANKPARVRSGKHGSVKGS